MAKITRTNYLDVVDNVWSQARKKGIMHIDLDDQVNHGKELSIAGDKLKNFGTCDYMGLENHPDLKEGAKKFIDLYGVQLAISRAYVRPTYAHELENLLSQIFGGRKTLVYSSTSSAHISVISNVVKPDDLILLDQQVHFSIQFPSKNMKLTGTTVKMIRHNDYSAIEDILKEESNRYESIWYMADGVYSMHGDTPDMEVMNGLLEKYPKFNCYFDDAHGMSWNGSNGSGFIFDKIKFHDRTWLMTTLGKSFGCIGGVAVLPDEETYRKIDVFGGPLSYSHPLPPPVMGAAIASAKIHLSPKMKEYQMELAGLMTYFEKRLKEESIPNISFDGTPIYFIATGLNRVTRNLVQRILKSGFYVNTATFPVVANDKSGIRISLNRHLTKDDIDGLVETIAHHFPLAMKEERDSFDRLYNDFGLDYKNEFGSVDELSGKYKLEIYNSVSQLNKDEWDDIYKSRGYFTVEGLLVAERVFSRNEEVEENWDFHYLILRNNRGEVALATFFASGLHKDDMLSYDNVSKKIEAIRAKGDRYFLCSQTLIMGSMFGEGDFLYVNPKVDHSDYKKLMHDFFHGVREIKAKSNSEVVVLRDFTEEFVLNDFFEDEGYAKIRMPNSSVIEHPFWDTNDEFLSLIKSKKKRYHVRRYAVNREHEFEITYKNELTLEERENYFKMFMNIKKDNFTVNFFDYPSKVVDIISQDKNWEFIDIKLKGGNETLACAWCYVGEDIYVPAFVGLNYDYLESYNLYKQIVFQIVKRGNLLRKKKVYCGYTADFEKQKLGAVTTAKFAYMKVDDTFNMELIDQYSNIDTL